MRQAVRPLSPSTATVHAHLIIHKQRALSHALTALQALSGTGQACGTDAVCPQGTHVCDGGICKVTQWPLVKDHLSTPCYVYEDIETMEALMRLISPLCTFLNPPLPLLQRLCDPSKCDSSCSCPSGTPVCDGSQCKVAEGTGTGRSRIPPTLNVLFYLTPALSVLVGNMRHRGALH